MERRVQTFPFTELLDIIYSNTLLPPKPGTINQPELNIGAVLSRQRACLVNENNQNTQVRNNRVSVAVVYKLKAPALDAGVQYID